MAVYLSKAATMVGSRNKPITDLQRINPKQKLCQILFMAWRTCKAKLFWNSISWPSLLGAEFGWGRDVPESLAVSVTNNDKHTFEGESTLSIPSCFNTAERDLMHFFISFLSDLEILFRTGADILVRYKSAIGNLNETKVTERFVYRRNKCGYA